MRPSRVQEAIEILKASVEDSSAKRKRVSKAEPKKLKKLLVNGKKVRKS